MRLITRIVFVLHLTCLASQIQAVERAVSFNRDIRPILSDRCFACHGPDSETVEAGLRLDRREDATSGDAIVPGDADASELVHRITSTDDRVMPPRELHKPLDAKQVSLIRRWIDSGAEYEPHWAYTPLIRREIPVTKESSWGRNDLDRFIARRLEDESMTPSSPADPVTLIRRLSFDLTGLPPTASEVRAFVNDHRDGAYDRLVKRLLDSERYGERMAIYWLDLVRYADSVGYHGDQEISQSPYRDYVINAFNSNMPYDQFIREQLAGDLLPNPTTAQLVASGYNRLNQTTEEGGAQPKEYLAIYFADRVRNVSQVFMGATVGCAQCHDHKYDPYTAQDFYSLGAFFADVQEQGKYAARRRPPEIPVPSDAERDRLETLRTKIEEESDRLRRTRERLLAQQARWESEVVERILEAAEGQTVWLDDDAGPEGKLSGDWNHQTTNVFSGATSRRQSSNGLVQHFFTGAKQAVDVGMETKFYCWVFLDPDDPPQSMMLQWNDGKSWDHRAVWGQDKISFGSKPKSWNGYQRQGELPSVGKWVRLEVAASDVGFGPGDVVNGMAFAQFGGTAYWDRAGWISKSGVATVIVEALKTPSDERDAVQQQQVSDYYLSVVPAMVQQQSKLEKLRSESQSILDQAPTAPITKAVEPRVVRVLPRGNWMDDSGPVVQPAIPRFLGELDTGGRRATRLDLANWLSDEDNVLTARTMVNRLWFLMFGRGICASVDDLGGQGTFPSHPELLDYLSIRFIDSGGDIKGMLQFIANSETYRQSSRPSRQLRSLDPYNEWFARQGRFRISAEMVRDTMLAISGLLVEQVGGRSARPYQPEGYYAQLNFPRRTYVADKGRNQYRRGVYTHWQRTFLHPMLKAFDAPSREECTAMRARSNTPLQALTLLNDPTFVEAARVFAERIMTEGGDSMEEKIAWAYQSAVSRKIDSAVAAELKKLYQEHQTHFDGHPEDARQLISQGDAPLRDDLDPAKLAAWTSVARAILNLHETITRY